MSATATDRLNDRNDEMANVWWFFGVGEGEL